MPRLARYLSMGRYFVRGAAVCCMEKHSGVRWYAMPPTSTITAGSFRLPRASTGCAGLPGTCGQRIADLPPPLGHVLLDYVAGHIPEETITSNNPESAVVPRNTAGRIRSL